MDSSDLTLTLTIIIIFILLLCFNFLVVGIKRIRNNWPLYRCNPMVMPFAGFFGFDARENFSYCIQNIQANYMGHLMAPMHYNTKVLSEHGTSLNKGSINMRGMMNKMRVNLSDSITSIFSVFYNMIIEIQRLMINLKSMFSQLGGVIATLMYTLSGSIMTVNSLWDGPPGQLVRALCFHPDTLIQLEDETFATMRSLPLNARLKNGSRVHAVMNISNLQDDGKSMIEQVYRLRKGGEKGEDILVSGSHLVFDTTTLKFVHVHELAAAEPTDVKCETFACLITSDHIIPIGKWLFHDWEDNNGSPSKSN